MSFDWEDYLRLAEKIVNDPISFEHIESAHRSAMSRSYYAAFHIAASKSGYPLTGFGEDHSALRRHLSGLHNRTSKDLAELYELRRAADYDDALDDPAKKMAETAVVYARRIVSSLSGGRGR